MTEIKADPFSPLLTWYVNNGLTEHKGNVSPLGCRGEGKAAEVFARLGMSFATGAELFKLAASVCGDVETCPCCALYWRPQHLLIKTKGPPALHARADPGPLSVMGCGLALL